ncbi:MAG: multisubunit Na+/H+ antiporter MnhB subunit [Gammaproteobacteria bacterium]|jgi:multisubunit Na+/H+ antiporter MnhB subunit
MFQNLESGAAGDITEQPVIVKAISAGVIACLSISLIYILALDERKSAGLAALVQQKLPDSGVTNPVTAVLLNFRSYDTLLEVAVLLIVAIAMLPPAQARNQPFISVNQPASANPILHSLLRWLIPILIVVAGYMLWTGAHSPGGAFQAAALLAGGGILLILSGCYRFQFDSLPARLLLSFGLIIFVLVAALVATQTGTILQFPVSYSGGLILLIETALTLSIASILLLLYSSLSMQIPTAIPVTTAMPNREGDSQ